MTLKFERGDRVELKEDLWDWYYSNDYPMAKAGAVGSVLYTIEDDKHEYLDKVCIHFYDCSLGDLLVYVEEVKKIL